MLGVSAQKKECLLGGKDVRELRKYFEKLTTTTTKNQIRLSYDMTNHVDLGGCYPPRP